VEIPYVIAAALMLVAAALVDRARPAAAVLPEPFDPGGGGEACL
jgi:hypothetical protein